MTVLHFFLTFHTVRWYSMVVKFHLNPPRYSPYDHFRDVFSSLTYPKDRVFPSEINN